MTIGVRSTEESAPHQRSARSARPSGALQLVAPRDYSEREPLDAIRAGDVQAFERLYHRYYGALCAVANGYVRSRAVAEELVQDLLLTLWTERTRLAIRESLRVYLFTAVRNRALNSVRHTLRESVWAREVRAGGDPVPRVAGTDHACEAHELAGAIATTIAALPERRRLAFQLTHQAGLSHAEASVVMGIAAKTVAIHVGLARAELRHRLRSFVEG